MKTALEVTAVATILRVTRSGMTVWSIEVLLENSTSGMLSMDTVCALELLVTSFLSSLWDISGIKPPKQPWHLVSKLG